MRANFHLSADFEIVVESDLQMGGVTITTLRGVCYEHPVEQPCPDEPHNADNRRVTADAIVLPKNHARAIASAIMGCAAEL